MVVTVPALAPAGPPLIGASMYVTLPFEISCMCLDNAKVSKGFPLVWSRMMALGLVSNGANSLQIVLEMAEVGKHKDTFKNQNSERIEQM